VTLIDDTTHQWHFTISKIPPWIVHNPTILWNLLYFGNKTNCSPTLHISAFNHIKDTDSILPFLLMVKRK